MTDEQTLRIELPGQLVSEMPLTAALTMLLKQVALMQSVVDAAREQVAKCDCEDGRVFVDVWRKVPCPKCSRFRQPLADLDAADG